MPKYFSIVKGPINIGHVSLITGCLVELDEEFEPGKINGRTIRRYRAFNQNGHPLVFIYDDQVEPIDFEPSPLWNHAVMVGFNSDPRFLQRGVNAVLERIYWMNGNFDPFIPMDRWLDWYVKTEDESRLISGIVRRENALKMSDEYRRRYEFLERLQKSVEEFNKRGSIENF